MIVSTHWKYLVNNSCRWVVIRELKNEKKYKRWDEKSERETEGRDCV